MIETRKCKQCGRELNIERFRYLRGERKTGKRGRQHTCMDCDTVNARYRKLVKLDNPTEEQTIIITKTEQLYKILYERDNNVTLPLVARERLGISVPVPREVNAISSLDDMIEMIK